VIEAAIPTWVDYLHALIEVEVIEAAIPTWVDYLHALIEVEVVEAAIPTWVDCLVWDVLVRYKICIK
jgi:hypothetical protein